MWVPNVFDPYAMGLYCEIKMKLENLNLVEYLPYVEYGGDLGATERYMKF